MDFTGCWKAAVFAVIAILLSDRCAASRHGMFRDGRPSPSKYLYVWAGAANPSTDKDSLFVVDVDKGSKTYGEVINQISTPYNGLEPHHCAVSADRKRLGCGGLLSVLAPGPPPSVLFFDIEADPLHPALIPGVAQPSLSAMADEFHATRDGGFLVTLMGSAAGGSPGRVAKYDKDLNLVGEYPQGAAESLPTGFNPHGIAVDEVRGTMLTADYVEPASTLLSQPGPTFRTTVRLWNLTDMTITRTHDVSKFGARGMMDAALAGKNGAYYFTGGNGYLHYVDPGSTRRPSIAFDFGVRNTVACIIRPFRNGTRLLAGQFGQSKVLLFDTTRPAKPKLLDTLQLPAGAGAHVTRVGADERIAAVATYFLAEGPAGRVNLPGDCTVRLLSLDAKGKDIQQDSRLARTIDFKAIGGGFRPHGLAFY